MTRSFGGGPESEPRNKEPELKEGASGPDWEQKLNRLSRYSEDETYIQSERVETGKRLVALIIDFFAANVVAVVFGFLPFVSYHLVMTLMLLIRDFFFEGRGIGKNLMGLQVVDVRTGQPCSFMQSILRNSIVLGPILIYFIFTTIIRLLPSGMITDALVNILNTIGMVYTLIVIPYEAYRVYNRSDGRRFGDQFAGTTVVEAHMDFSTPLPRQRK